MRAANATECLHGGIVVSDGTNAIPVCNGAPGATGATGANGLNGSNGARGATGATGSPGPPGISATGVTEYDLIGTVRNVRVRIGTLPDFHPSAMSSVRFVANTGSSHSAANFQLAPVKLFLGPDADLGALAGLWQSTLQGQPEFLQVRFFLEFLDTGKPVPAVDYRVGRMVVTAFSDGSVNPPYIVLEPFVDIEDKPEPMTFVYVLNLIGSAERDALESLRGPLPVLSTPSVEFNSPSGDPLAVTRIAGGEPVLGSAAGGGGVGGGLLQYSDLNFTITAFNTQEDPTPIGFERILADLQMAAIGGLTHADVTVRALSPPPKPALLKTILYDNSQLTSFTLINAYLSGLNNGVAPMVLDVSVKPLNVQ